MIKKGEEKLKVLKYHRFNFDCATLRTMYTSYIRPKLEYSSPVWIGILKRDQERLEQLNLSAARAISWCKIGTSHQKLYDHCNLQTLICRQSIATKMCLFDAFNEKRLCRINSYYFDVISRANPYSICRSTEIRPIRCYTEAHRSSFLPTGINMLNTILSVKPNCLSETNRDVFKKFVTPENVKNVIFKVQHTRKSSVLMARIRSGNCDLLENLFVRNLSDTYMCPSCGDVPETPEHYFVFCREYDTCRSNLVENIPIEAWNLDCILYVSARYTISLNYLIQIEAQKYIMSTKRFT